MSMTRMQKTHSTHSAGSDTTSSLKMFSEKYFSCNRDTFELEVSILLFLYCENGTINQGSADQIRTTILFIAYFSPKMFTETRLSGLFFYQLATLLFLISKLTVSINHAPPNSVSLLHRHLSNGEILLQHWKWCALHLPPHKHFSYFFLLANK